MESHTAQVTSDMLIFSFSATQNPLRVPELFFRIFSLASRSAKGEHPEDPAPSSQPNAYPD